MKDVYIVLVIINDTVEVDSVYWNNKKAQARADEILANSDGCAYVLKKWVNPTIVLSSKEYTQKRAAKLKMPPFFPLLVDSRQIAIVKVNMEVYYSDYRLIVRENQSGKYDIYDNKYGRITHKDVSKEQADERIQSIVSRRKRPTKDNEKG